ncbi:YlbF family regulator [Chloroflexota bacterium]
MNTNITKIPPDLLAANKTLAETLLHSEPLLAYHQAKTHLERDAEASAFLERLSTAQNEFRVRQSKGSVTQADIDRLRVLQNEVQANKIIMLFVETQQAAIAYLPEVNKEISQLLGFDFAGMAGPASC